MTDLTVMEARAEQKADKLLEKFSLGAWPTEHALTCVTEIISCLNELDQREAVNFWFLVKLGLLQRHIERKNL